MTEKHVDVVVIGAGLGGLSAACTLAKAGKRVLVLEHHAVPGGYAHDFRRGPYRFEVSLHALDGIAPGGLAYPVAQELELWERLRFHRLDPFYSVRFPQHHLDISADLATYESQLIHLFPQERDGLHSLIDAMKQVYWETQRNQQERLQGHVTDLSEMAERFPNLLNCMAVSWDDFMSQHIQDPTLKTILSTLWGYLGLPPKELNAHTFIILWTSYHLFGAYYPDGGSMAISRCLADLLTERGGEIEYRQTVDHIEIQDNRAITVTTQQGLRICADMVLSNASAPTTMLELVGAEHLPKRYVRRLQRLQPSVSSLVVYLGLDRDLSAEGFDFHEIFFYHDYDLDNDYQAVYEGNFAQSSFVMTHYTHIDKEAAPAGGSVLALMCLTTWELFAAWHDPANNKHYQNESAYQAYKEAAADALISRAEQWIPGLRSSIRYKEISTPLTNVRYSLNHHGAIYGAAQSVEQSFVTRPGADTPIVNLWNVGAWSFVGGMSAALISGHNVAQQIITSSQK